MHVVGLSLRRTIDESDVSISHRSPFRLTRGLIAIATRNAGLIKLASTLESRNFPFKNCDERKKGGSSSGTHVRCAFNPPPLPRGLPRGIHPVHSGRFHSAERVTIVDAGGEGVSTEHFPNNAVLLRYEIIPASSLTFAHAKLLEHQRRDASHIIRSRIHPLSRSIICIVLLLKSRYILPLDAKSKDARSSMVDSTWFFDETKLSLSAGTR